jgi:hypothetical protein
MHPRQKPLDHAFSHDLDSPEASDFRGVEQVEALAYWWHEVSFQGDSPKAGQ